MSEQTSIDMSDADINAFEEEAMSLAEEGVDESSPKQTPQAKLAQAQVLATIALAESVRALLLVLDVQDASSSDGARSDNKE